MSGDDMDNVENLKVKVVTLETELASTRQELETCREDLKRGTKALDAAQRKLEKANLYNEDLRKQMIDLSSEIQLFRDKSKNLQHFGAQAVAEEILTELGNKPLPQWDNGVSDTCNTQTKETTAPALSIAESLKQAAEETLSQSGFVFDDKTGMYYDCNSGYYYNCEQGLYYDPNTGTYFYYDDTTGEYQFHSQVEPQPYIQRPDDPSSQATTAAVASPGDNEKARKKTAEKRKRIRESTEDKKKKKRKKEREKRDRSSSRRKTVKKKSKRKRHHSHHDKEDNSGENNKNVCDSDKDSESYKHSKKHKRVHKHRKSSRHGEGKSRRSHDHSKRKHSRHKNGPDNVSDKERDPADVELGEIVVESGEEREERTEKTAVVYSDGELSVISSTSLATGESELESGELSSDSESVSSLSEMASSLEEDVEEQVASQDTEEVSASWPPCIRVMVTESDCLDEGTLFIVTCDGATIGRDDIDHLIMIPDINVSQLHAQIQYDYDLQNYVITDTGSQNGTFINDQQISQSEGEICALSHGDVLRLGNTTLLLHIHPGTDTCDDCEPGQVIGRLQALEKANKEIVITSKADRIKEHRKQLKQIKKKYGLKDCAYEDNMAAVKNSAYEDKAATRRRVVGSDNPHVRDEAPASVMKPISTENKGHKLLAKMGWKEGQGLGKDNAGIAEPVNVMLRTNQAAGLGSGAAMEKTLDDVHSAKKSQRWLQARQRYNKLEKKKKEEVDLSRTANISFSFKKGPTVLEKMVDCGAEEDKEEEQPG